MFSGLLGDVRRAARTLRRRPGFVAVVALTMGIGVGAVGAVYAVADHLLLRAPAGVGDVGGIAYLSFDSPERQNTSISGPAAEEIRRSATLLEGVATYEQMNLRVSVTGVRPLDVRAVTVYGDYFELLRVRPAAGRLLAANETGPGADPDIAVISEKVAQQLFGSSSAAVGRTLETGGRTLSVIGVAGGGFSGTDRNWAFEAWLPAPAFVTLGGGAENQDYRRERFWSPAARLNQFFVARTSPGVSFVAAKEQIDGILAGLGANAAGDGAYLAELEASLHQGLMRPLEREMVSGTIAVLSAGAVLLLLITCANAANLLLVRGMHRRGDVALSRALGASKGRVTRERLAENVLLAAGGTIVGVGVAWLIAFAFRGFSIIGLPAFEGFALDASVLGFAAAAVVVTSVLAGALPALLSARFDLADTLRDSSTQATTRSGMIRYGMSALQIGLSLTLLIGSLLLVRTVRNLYAVDPGIELDGVGAVTVAFGGDDPTRPGPEQDVLLQRMLAAASAAPGVEAAALHTWFGPYEGAPQYRVALSVDGEPQTARVNWVTSGWFEMLEVEVLAGRTFRPEDWSLSGPMPIVVTSALARRLFGTADVLGRTVHVGVRTFEPAEIVGVVGDLRLMELDAPPDEGFFMPRPFSGYSNAVTVLFKSSDLGAGVMGSVQAALEAALPSTPIPLAAPLADRIDLRLAEQRLFAQLLTLFSVLAVVLAAVGLYGVVAFAVAGRRREFGIRMALGADGKRLRALVLRSAALVVAIGISAGLASAAALSRVIESRLFGVEAVDLASYVGSAGLLVAVALLACWLPARSAMTTDPAATLRD
jgi:predicted permease